MRTKLDREALKFNAEFIKKLDKTKPWPRIARAGAERILIELGFSGEEIKKRLDGKKSKKAGK